MHGWQSDDDGEAEAALVALNRIGERGGWHDEDLAESLRRISEATGFEGTGFMADDLDALLLRLNPPEPPESDEVPAAPEKPISELGDIWVVGDQRIICGDARDPDAYDQLMDSTQADLVWTDPPYGVAIASRIGTTGVSSSQARSQGNKGIDNDTVDIDALTEMLRSSLGLAKDRTKSGGVWYVAAPHGPVGLAFAVTLSELGIWQHSLVWVKDSLVLGRSDFHYRHEPLYYGWKQGAAHHFAGDRTYDTVWEIPRPHRSEEHPTMKPLELMMRAMRLSSRPGDHVLDPFVGSGSTLVAAHRTGRLGYGIEIDPAYVDVTVRRLAAEVGEKPGHAVSGGPFPLD